MSYEVSISENADAEFAKYIAFIISEYKSPITATKHHDGIMRTIRELRKNPFVNAIRYNSFLQKYGYGIKRANFQKNGNHLYCSRKYYLHSSNYARKYDCRNIIFQFSDLLRDNKLMRNFGNSEINYGKTIHTTS
jgi:hypothetical protein